METRWEQAKARLSILFPDAMLRGHIKGRLLGLSLKERLEYFEGEDVEAHEALKALMPSETGNDFVIRALGT